MSSESGVFVILGRCRGSLCCVQILKIHLTCAVQIMSVCLSQNLVDVALVLEYLCKYIMVSQAITKAVK